MLYQIPDCDLDRFIEEDAPYGDLTTHLLGIGEKEGRIVFFTREETTLCCTEEGARIFTRLGARVTRSTPSGTLVAPGSEVLEAEGPVRALHTGWKVTLNLLEYASGVASRTARIVQAAVSVNPAISVLTTRKSFPGTKKTVIKAIAAGGALPHRLGLSETILVFRQHTDFVGGHGEFLKTVPALRARAKEKVLIVEADTADEAILLARAGVDVIQVDKMDPSSLRALVIAARAEAPAVKISAAGGINESNAKEYAATGVDMIVLSSVYFGKPSDMGVRMIPL